MKFIWLLFLKITGWRIGGMLPVPEEFRKRCVVIAAPHTTNWDLPYCLALMAQLDIDMRYTIKKEWLFFPMNIILKPLGAIGIDRRPRKETGERPSMVESMVQLFKEREQLALVIPPEGSRSLRKEWKMGFYYTALGAGVPIVLGFLDYQKKEGGALGVVYPTGNVEADMKLIMSYYQNVQGKFPELFSLDQRYLPDPAE